MNHKDYKDENYINEIVDKYKETGSEEFKNKLIKEFDGYFTKYAYLLCSSVPINLNNKDTITFLRLFMTKEERSSEQSIHHTAKRVINYIRTMFKDCTIEDIHDDMVSIFLEQLKRYKPMIANHKHDKPRISFVHFVQVNMRFRLKDTIRVRQRDALSCTHNVEYNDELYSCHNTSISIERNWNDLDVRWVLGETTGDMFDKLTDIERYLLYLKYQDNIDKPLSDYDIAKITGMNRMYIRRKIIKIRSKLKTLVGIS